MQLIDKNHKKLIFFFEKTFLNRQSGCKLIRKQRGEPMPDYTHTGLRRVTVNCLANITANGVGEIWWTSDGMNDTEYADILRRFLPQMKEQVENLVFVQDNALIYKVNKVENVIADLDV